MEGRTQEENVKAVLEEIAGSLAMKKLPARSDEARRRGRRAPVLGGSGLHRAEIEAFEAIRHRKPIQHSIDRPCKPVEEKLNMSYPGAI